MQGVHRRSLVQHERHTWLAREISTKGNRFRSRVDLETRNQDSRQQASQGGSTVYNPRVVCDSSSVGRRLPLFGLGFKLLGVPGGAIERSCYPPINMLRPRHRNILPASQAGSTTRVGCRAGSSVLCLTMAAKQQVGASPVTAVAIGSGSTHLVRYLAGKGPPSLRRAHSDQNPRPPPGVSRPPATKEISNSLIRRN